MITKNKIKTMAAANTSRAYTNQGFIKVVDVGDYGISSKMNFLRNLGFTIKYVSDDIVYFTDGKKTYSLDYYLEPKLVY